jgi:hypothetical protein
LFPHNAPIFFSELVSNTLHGVDVFTGATTQDEHIIATGRADDLIEQIDAIPRDSAVDDILLRRTDICPDWAGQIEQASHCNRGDVRSQSYFTGRTCHSPSHSCRNLNSLPAGRT